MEFRLLLRPLPLFFIFLFVAVAIADLVQTVSEEPIGPPEIQGSAIPTFDALEPVVDLRLSVEDSTVKLWPVPELAHDRWSAPERRGVWARTTASDLVLELMAGGHRALILECMPAGGKRPVRAVRLTINGFDCGKVALSPGWKKYRFVLPEGVVRPGSNRIVLGFPDRDTAARPRRALLVRRFGLFVDEGADIDSLQTARPVSIDFGHERVTLRRSGTLEIPLVLDDRIDALQMRYHFPSGVGRAEVTVVRSQDESAGIDDVLGQTVNAERESSGRIRIPLHGRRGECVLRIRAELGPMDSPLMITSLRLVEEGDPTRRPWAAQPPRN